MLHTAREIGIEDIPRVTNQEVLGACRNFDLKETSGHDGIPNKTFKLAVPELLSNTMENATQTQRKSW